ncbi:MAG TPA: response regulator transcription factor [Polyangia bacterium]|nr:response regulator transcription factor [Polyangia bacterium]
MTDSRTQLLLVEDDERIAEVIRAVLAAAGYAHMDLATTAASAEALVRRQAPDLVLVDLGLPDRDGTDLIRALRAAEFRRPILVLTSATSDERVVAALRAGADGYLFKDDIEVRLAIGLRDLARGGAPLSPGAARAVLQQLGYGQRALTIPALTPREAKVLELLATGGGYSEIAQDLGVELNTVRTHVRSIYEKLGVENRAEAVNLAWNLGLLHRAG